MTPDQYRREGAEAMREAAANEWQHVKVEGGRAMAALLAYEARIRAIDVDEVLAEVCVVDPLTAAAITLRDAIEGDDRADMHRLLSAACFGAERFDKMSAAPITHDGAPMAMLRDLLTAIIDPSDPALDDLRACNQPALTRTALSGGDQSEGNQQNGQQSLAKSVLTGGKEITPDAVAQLVLNADRLLPVFLATSARNIDFDGPWDDFDLSGGLRAVIAAMETSHD